MAVHAFYNTKSHLSVVAALASVFVAPHSQGAPTPLLQQVNPLLGENPVRILPASTIFMNPPPTPGAAPRNPMISDVLGRAFRNEDLSSLYGAGAFGSCETSSRIPSFFEKNYSNFAHACLEEHRNRQAITFDERFQSDPHLQGHSAAPLGGRLQWTSISSAARERLLQRSIHDLAQRNKTLSDIIQGRISFDFGLGQFWSSDAPKISAQVTRPRYVVELETAPNQPVEINKRKLIASIGPLPQGSFEGNAQSAHWLSKKPQRAKRVLRETFEPIAAIEPASQSVSDADNSSAQSESVLAQSDSTSTITTLQYLSNRVGLRQIPFTKMNLRAERRVVEGQNQFALRATESQELMFAEVPDIRSASVSTMIWGYKIPWKQHALNVTHNEASKERTTSYSYKLDDSNKTDVSYNHLSKAVSAGFVMSF